MKIERIVKVNRGGARGCVAENRVCQVEYHTKRDSRCLITSGPPLTLSHPQYLITRRL